MSIAARAIAARDGNVTPLPNRRTSEWFATEILSRWSENVASIFKVATMLETAREELGRAEFVKMYREQLKWSKQTVSNLIAIAEDGRFAEYDMSYFPANWGTLYALTRLTQEEFQKGIDTGIIHAGMERKDIKDLKPPKPPKEKPVPKPKTIDAIGCALAVRDLVFEAGSGLAADELRALISDLRKELDHAEKTFLEGETA